MPNLVKKLEVEMGFLQGPTPLPCATGTENYHA